LRKEIEDLKIENEKIMKDKKELEKNKIEMGLEIKGLKTDNEWLEMQWNQEQEQIERLKNDKEESKEYQKKIENELNQMKEEMLKNQKILEESISRETIENKMIPNVEEKEILCSDLISSDCSDFVGKGIRKRNHFKKKQETELFEHPSTYQMKKDDLVEDVEKKNIIPTAEKENITKIYNPIETSHHIIDVQSSDQEHEEQDYPQYPNDQNNFFLHMTGLVSKFINQSESDEKEKEEKLRHKLEKYERLVKELTDKNKEYLTKIQNYECQNILDFNRKLRLGIPIKFFPCHTYGLEQPSIKKDHLECDDLH
jgi:hypothetical protein